jgi:acyl phosphate:glycerol-3-phosphate acyltransferase
MPILLGLLAIVFSYIIGSIPFGLIVVKISTGRDVRFIGSGRIGGTNVMRAAGLLAGAVTAVMDILKGFASKWIVDLLLPDAPPILRVLAAAFAVWGSIHSIFLIERKENGRLHLRGGAGGATCGGAAMALFPNIWMILIPVAVLVYIFIGYASVTTISIALGSLLIFSIRALMGASPWQYILFGILALGEVLYALRPNLIRLRNGTERMVGLRAYRHNQKIAREGQTKSKPN